MPAPESSRPFATADRGAGLAAVVMATATFSWGFIIVKSLALPPVSIALFRLLLGAVLLTGVALLLRIRWPQERGWALAAGLVFGVHQLAYMEASQTTSIAIVSLIAATQPLWVALVSRRTVGERVPPALFGWSLVAIAGVLVVVRANLGDPSETLFGDLIALANVLIFTTYFLLAKRVRTGGAPTLTMSASVLWGALLVLLPALPFTGAKIPSTDGALLIVLLVLGPGNGHLFLNWAHPRVSATLASLVLAGTPLLSTLWAHLVLGEPYTWRHVVGIALVVVAIMGGRRAEMRRLARATAAAGRAAEPITVVERVRPPVAPG